MNIKALKRDVKRISTIKRYLKRNIRGYESCRWISMSIDNEMKSIGEVLLTRFFSFVLKNKELYNEKELDFFTGFDGYAVINVSLEKAKKSFRVEISPTSSTNHRPNRAFLVPFLLLDNPRFYGKIVKHKKQYRAAKQAAKQDELQKSIDLNIKELKALLG